MLGGSETSIKTTSRRLRTAWDAYVGSTRIAEGEHQRAEQDYDKGVSQAREELAKAGVGLKIASFPSRLRWARALFGFSGSVVLYEDRIDTPEGTNYLTSNVKASVDQQGMVQSVQGWVFKGDKDLREAFLNIQGDGWGTVIRVDLNKAAAATTSKFGGHSLGWNSKNWRANTQEMRRFAQEVELAAQNRDEARTAIEARKQAAKLALADRLSNFNAVDAAVSRLDDLAQSPADLNEVVSELRDATDGEDERGTRKAHDLLRRAEASVEETITRSKRAVAEWGEKRERAEQEARDLRASALVEHEDSSGDIGEGSPLGTAGDDVIEQIRRLGELRDAGVLSEAEFAEKKAELLGRL